MLVSAMYNRINVEENIRLLEMAPDDETCNESNPECPFEDYAAVRKMKQYSDEFDAGQAGLILVEGDISATLVLPWMRMIHSRIYRESTN